MQPHSASRRPRGIDHGPELIALAHCLHDDLAQSLALALIQLDRASADGDAQALLRAQELVRQAMRATRGLLARLPSEGLSQELAQALRALAMQLSRQCARDVGFAMQGQLPPLPSEVGTALLAATRELLLNACKHGAAGSVDACLYAHQQRISITVSNPAPQALGHPPGLGLSLLQARLREVGANLRWRSQGRCGVQARITWSGP